MVSYSVAFIKRGTFDRCYKITFSVNIQAFVTDVSCETSKLFRTVILKNNQGKVLLYCNVNY